ncbi:DNA-binding protein [Candidatus Termititenax persephonae]|uniref:DNA-binding protein n=1 Tax=Candidatus Termititenax persephonae TaxID=2218525 RepID=A0A388TFM9_9BACT|nr:DNA-binding protein [Candidatus Termititenax persephonae]
MADSKNPKRWLEFANMDLSTAEHLLNKHPTPYEIICYLCQQAAEKYLKGFLIARTAKEPPHIHDLDELCKLCKEISVDFSTVADICSELTEYGVQSKYPTDMAIEKDDVLQAIQDAKTLKSFLQKQAADLFPE